MKTQNHPPTHRRLASLSMKKPLAYFVACFALLSGVTVAEAVNGTWTNDASSVWSDTASWLNGIVADGTDASADFSTIDITAARTVTVDASHNVGTLLFGGGADTHTNNWTLASTGNSLLTLAVSSGSPTITVSNGVSTNTAVFNVPLVGTQGLTKTGAGTLVLASTNSYSGTTTVSGGTLQLTNAAAAASGPLLYMSFDNVSGNTVINGGSLGAVADGVIVGTNVSIAAGGRFGNGLQVGTGPVTSGGVFINHAVTLLNNTNNTTVNAWTVAMWVKTTTTTNGGLLYQGGNTWASGNTRFYMAGNTNDAGGPFFGGVRNSQGWEVGQSAINDGNWHFVAMTTAAPGNVKKIYVDGNLDSFSATANDNLWTNNATGNQVWIGGAPNISDNNVGLNGMIDEVYIYNRALSPTEVTALFNTSSTPPPQVILPATTPVSVAASSKLDLNGLSSTIAGLSGSGTVDTTLTNAGAAPFTPTLTINNSSDTTFAGTISNTAGILSVVKTGAGALTLTNVSGYTGNTILNNGTLNINSASAIGTAGTLIINGGTLDNTSGAAVTVINNKTETWSGDFTFTGTTNLSFGTGGVSLSGPGTNRTVTVNSNMLSVGVLNGSVTAGPSYGLIKAGAGSLFLGGAGASILANRTLAVNGGTLLLSQDMGGSSANAPVSLTGTGTIETSGTGVNKWFWMNNTADCTFSGTLQNYPGQTSRGLGLNKAGTGTLTLNGNATFNDTVTLQAGTIRLDGAGILITNTATADVIGSTTTKAVLQITNGASFFENFNSGQVFNNSIGVGSVANALAAIQMSSGTLTCNRQLNLAYASGAYAAYSQSGGTATVGGFLAMGVNGGSAVVNDSGGSFTMTGGPATIGAAAAGIGILNLSGTATFTNTATGDNGLWFGENGTGTLNISGNATLTLASGNNGLELGRNSGANGTANLNGGTVTAKTVYTGNAGATSTLNFNGGTLKANIDNPTFVTGLSGAYVYSGGATIDDGGFAVTVGQVLQAPAGYGVVSIPVSNGGSNYFDTPVVTITNISASGSGAKAIANVSGGAITSITVTSPGHDYGSGDVLGVSITGGGGAGAVTGSPVLAANTSGGLTKLGSGTLTLGTGNGYTGATKVLAGTLNLNYSTLSASGDLLVSNSTVVIDASSGNSFNALSVTLQNNATVSLAYGNLSANPSFPAVNASGSLAAPGTGITISISALGLKPGTITLIKYTGTPLASLANFSLSLPPGVAATLVNNTGNDSIDMTVSAAPQNLFWEGVAGNNWDINVTANWKDINNNGALYLQYTNGPVVVGDATTFNDTLTNDFVNPQPTNINLATAVYSFPVTVDSTLPYSFTGVGGLTGTGYLVKSNSGSLTIGTSNSFSGGTYIYGGLVIITNDSALGASSGAVTFAGGTLQANGNITNTRPISVTAASSLDVPTNLTVQLGGIASGAGTLTKVDNGTLVVAGTMSNALAVAAGTARVPVAGKISATSLISVGNTGASSGVLTISGGTVQANNNPGQFGASLAAGPVSGAAGDIQMSSGTLTTAQQLDMGVGQGGYGAFTMSGGTATLGSYLVVGFTGDTAVLNQSGGAITVTTNCPTIAAGSATSLAVATFSGGSLTAVNSTNGNSSGRGGMFVGENGTGFLNVMGSAALTLFGDANLTLGRQAGSAGTVNLLGGSISTPQVSKGTGASTFNFNGGVLKAATNNTSFMAGLTSATVYSGGAAINDGGFAITIGQPLLAPAGYGVTSIPVTAGGSGYIDSPVVTLSGGNGSNATAIAQVNYTSGVVTNLLITCPGTGYANGDSLSVAFTGGGGTGATAGTPVLAANVSGGLTKTGTGVLTLTGASTYTGATIVSTGQVLVTSAYQVTGSVTVSNSAGFGVIVGTGSSATIGNLTLGTSATGTNLLVFVLNTGTNPAAPVLQAGTLTLNGTNSVRLGGQLSVGTFPVLKYTGAVAGSGVFNTNVIAPQGAVATLSNSAASSTLYVTVSSVGAGLVWTGTNSTAGQTNVWGLNSITNWLVGSAPAFYQEVVPPGDAVTFNDLGSGTVLLSNTVSPSTLTVSNSAVAYSFQGSGHLAGTMSVIKLGAGTVKMGLSGSTYAGNTVISNGIYQLGSGTAIPDGAGSGNVAIGSSGTLDMAGFSETINGLSGTGLIDNSSATASVLTLGNGDGAVTWAGTITNTGTGGNSIIKVGAGNTTITGTNYLRSAAASQVNGGTLLITNGGALYMSGSAEFWVQQNAGNATVIVDGGTLVTSNNWLVIGRNNAAATGTLIVNKGTVQKAGANNIVVGSLGATGYLYVNGGQVLNNGSLWLGENATANAYLYLNGGLIQAAQVRPQGATPVTSIAYFNGGTLQATASSTNYLQVQSMVQSGGLILDDNGFTLTINTAALQDGGGGGGLIKKGAGTVYLDVGNSYTGTTVVTNGTLAGIGTIASPVVVGPAGTIGAGDSNAVGTLTINNDLTINGKAALRISKNGGTPASDLISGLNNANYGGTLVISNVTSDATPIVAGDTFTLFNASAHNGSFTSIVGSPGSGLGYSFANGVLTVVTTVNPNPTNLVAVVNSGKLELSWPADHIGWRLQAQTNSLATGLNTNWVDVPNTAAVNSVTNVINAVNGTVFYRMVYP